MTSPFDPSLLFSRRGILGAPAGVAAASAVALSTVAAHAAESFRPLLDGTTNWPAVMQALRTVGHDGSLTFEFFHPYEHYPEALVFQTSDSMDRMLGRKVYTRA